MNHIVLLLASYPDLPMFFNVSHEKFLHEVLKNMGRPGYEAMLLLQG